MELEPFVFEQEGVLIGMRSAPVENETEPEPIVAEVNRYALRPLGQDEFVVFTMDLCHNNVDRHFSRFPVEELEAINDMVPGRPLMERHDLRGSLPRGTFFRSELWHDGDHVSVRPDVYVLRTDQNRGFILNIEGGVYRETSMGFSFRLPECSICHRDLRACSHVPGRTYGDQQCHYIMRGVLEVIEGSVVPSGSQGTSFVSERRARPLDAALEDARQAYHRPIELGGARLWAAE